MSGPTTYGYEYSGGDSVPSVDIMAEERARQRRRLEVISRVHEVERQRGRILVLLDQLKAKSQDSVTGITVPAAARPENGSTEELSVYAEQLDQWVRETEPVLYKAMQRYVLSGMASGEHASPNKDSGILVREAMVKWFAESSGNAGESTRAEEWAVAVKQFLSVDDANAVRAALELKRIADRDRRVVTLTEQDRTTITELLLKLASDQSEEGVSLRRHLESAYTGDAEWTPALREAVEQRINTMAQTERDKKAAEILSQALKDLGYRVSPIEQTLFTEGGELFFQREGWRDYFMCLRVYPQRKAMNFNMVRASEGEPAAPERAKTDTEMEIAWCKSIPKLTETLSRRGFQTELIRNVDAGEHPVQVVRRERITIADGDQAGAGVRIPAPVSRSRNTLDD